MKTPTQQYTKPQLAPFAEIARSSSTYENFIGKLQEIHNSNSRLCGEVKVGEFVRITPLDKEATCKTGRVVKVTAKKVWIISDHKKAWDYGRIYKYDLTDKATADLSAFVEVWEADYKLFFEEVNSEVKVLKKKTTLTEEQGKELQELDAVLNKILPQKEKNAILVDLTLNFDAWSYLQITNAICSYYENENEKKYFLNIYAKKVKHAKNIVKQWHSSRVRSQGNLIEVCFKLKNERLVIA